MFKKCESCQHYRSEPKRSLIVLNGVNTGQAVRSGVLEYCTNDLCTTEEIREMFPDRKGMPLDMAREICDRESNGIFVHFEPRDPEAGAAFDEEFCTNEITGNCSCTACTARDFPPCSAPPVHITRPIAATPGPQPPPAALAAAGGVA